MIIAKKALDLKPVLMKGVRSQVKEPFYLISEGNQTIFVVTTGLNGTEFNKTIGYVNNFSGMQTYQCLYGQGVMLMQRNDGIGEAKEFKVVTLNPGRQVGVPVGWAMCLVNISKTFLVVVGNMDIESRDLDPKPIIEKQGLSYYIVEKKGEIGFEQNPNYRLHPQITTE